MNLNFVVFLIGLVGVPVVLLTFGHRLRRRSRRVQTTFWWAIGGYCVAGVFAIIYSMIPPEAWEAGETVRGFAGIWGMLAIPVVSAGVGAAVRAPCKT